MEIIPRGDGLYIIKLWSKRPPTNNEIINAGGTIVNYDRPTCEYVGEVNNGHDIKISASYDSVHTTTNFTNKRFNASKVPLDAVEWASQLYVVKIWYKGERVRIANILRDRDTGKLHVFDGFGMPIAILKARKRVKSMWVMSELNMTVEPIIDCVQLDAIRNARTEERLHVGETHRSIANNRMRRPKVG